MSPSVEDDLTLSPTGITEQSPQDQAPSNHHAPPDPSPPTPEVRGKRVPPRRGSVDRDAQELVISSLRTQVQDLVSQVTELNNKLVRSYDRVSDLEDDLHLTSSTLRTSSVKISELELERSQHLSALNTGLLVEKSHVTAELTRLMEKATEEAARRGQAESAQADIEKDLDDVSAALFDQANTMVAEARLGRAQSERKAEEAERALREAEDAVRLMQQELQALQGEKEAAERTMEGMSAAMDKGKWIERASSLPTNTHRLLTSHASYQEFLSLLSHLRALRATQPQPPTISSLLGLPFIARLQLEDTDPTTRLDAAPSLNWLTRRAFVAAIQTGQLTIEPIATQTILASATSPQPPLAVTVLHGSNNINLLSCGLCGHGIVPHAEPSSSRTGYLSRASLNGTQFNTWSSSIFRKSPVALTPSHSEPPSPPPYHDTSSLPAQLYIFRLSEPTPATPSALPLCVSGWCLARLRATCSLWSFLRISILEKVWEEEVQTLLPPPHREIDGANVDTPPVPPRRKGKNSGFWGVASSFGLDRVPLAGWGESEKHKRTESDTETRRFVAPPLRSNSPGPSSLVPPPLPSRNRSRKRKPVPTEGDMEGRRSLGTESSARESQSSVSDSYGSPTPVKPEVSPTLSSLLVSSPVEADPLSEEGFLTPSEDIAPPETVSTPAQVSVPVPQPEPSGDTPVAKPVPLPDDTSKEPAAPSPESKPAEPVTAHRKQRSSTSEHVNMRPHSPAPNAESPVSPPSRTGSPFAPPLPRRAAARRAVPPPPSAPSTPAPAPAPTADAKLTKETVGQPNGHHAEPQTRTEPDAKANIANPVVAPESDAPPTTSAQPDDPQKEKEAVSEPPTAETTEGSAVPATSGAEMGVVVDSTREAVVEPSADKSDETPPPPPPRRARSGDGDGDAAMQNATAAAKPPTRPPPPPRHPRPRRVPSTERRAPSDSSDNAATILEKEKGAEKLALEEQEQEQPGFALDGTPYVGDGTWEERTWKELTRLREDMFWARMGGVQ